MALQQTCMDMAVASTCIHAMAHARATCSCQSWYLSPGCQAELTMVCRRMLLQITGGPLSVNAFIATTNPTAIQSTFTNAKNSGALGTVLQPLGLYLTDNAPPPPVRKWPPSVLCIKSYALTRFQ